MKKKKVFLITGAAGAGKSTLAKGIIARGGVGSKIALADALKDFCDAAFGCNRDDKAGFSPIRTSDLQKVIPTFTSSNEYVTNREIYQYFGSEVVRAICPNAWVNIVINKIKNSSENLWLIDDARFPNEIESIAQDPSFDVTIIRLLRQTSNMNHISERALDNFDFTPYHTWEVNNTNLTEKMTLELVYRYL